VYSRPTGRVCRSTNIIMMLNQKHVFGHLKSNLADFILGRGRSDVSIIFSYLILFLKLHTWPARKIHLYS